MAINSEGITVNIRSVCSPDGDSSQVLKQNLSKPESVLASLMCYAFSDVSMS